MKIYVLTGSERPISYLKFTREGDMFLSASLDVTINLFDSETGERIGTQDHEGAVSFFDIDSNFKYVISVDMSYYFFIWDAQYGKILFKRQFNQPAMCIEFSNDENLIVVLDFKNIQIFDIQECLNTTNKLNSKINPKSSFNFEESNNIKQVSWGQTDEILQTSTENGFIQKRNANNGNIISYNKIHLRSIKRFIFSKEKQLILTASEDCSSKLLNANTLEILKQFYTDKPCRDVALHPLVGEQYNDDNKEIFGCYKRERHHAIIAGGQAARDVALTKKSAGQFEILFYNIINEEKVAQLGGHFGTVNSIDISNDGTKFISGSEDGQVRLHHLDDDQQFNSNFD